MDTETQAPWWYLAAWQAYVILMTSNIVIVIRKPEAGL